MIDTMATHFSEIIAVLAFMLSLGALLLSCLVYKREQRVERSAVYLQLETYSSTVFQYEADHATEMAPFRLVDKPTKIAKREYGEKVTKQLYLQSLNLFEVASNFRQNGVVDHETYASWIAWFEELVNDWYFREIWTEMRGNYTGVVRSIFDAGCLIYESEAIPAAKRQAAFYRAVAQTIEPGGCKFVMSWLESSSVKADVKRRVETIAAEYRKKESIET
jgi:hypothetical protein